MGTQKQSPAAYLASRQTNETKSVVMTINKKLFYESTIFNALEFDGN